MNGGEKILTAFDRNARALELRSSLGQGTARTNVTLTDGYRCEVQDGAWSFTVDMAEKSGGGAAGPDPGVYGRGALGACLAMTYAVWAERLGVNLTKLEVEVQVDYDSGPFHGVSDLPAGYRQVCYIVKLESDAPEQEIEDFLDKSDTHCAYLDVWTRPMNIRREVELSRPGGSES